MCCPRPWSPCSWPAPAAASLAPWAAGCPITCRPRSTGRQRNIALSTCVGASSASLACGWLADRIGRRVGFIAMLIEGAIFITLWVYTDNRILLWVFGLAWSFGFLGL